MGLGWILASCVVLSFYDLSKKASVRDNAVFPVLLGSTLTGFLAVTAFLIARGGFAATLGVGAGTMGLLLLKSCIVGASWTATYMALRTLPITSAAPIRATGPLWTLIGAVCVFAEVPTPLQAVGMALALVGCWIFSLSTKGEGVRFWHDRAIGLAFLGTLLGSCSALYDKCLLQQKGLGTGTVLWWFMGGMCVLYAVATGVEAWRGRGGADTTRPAFQFRWTIPLVGVLLATSDACYFNAISMPDAKISVLSLIRRSSVILTFLLGGAIFHEANLRRKGLALLAILAGVILLCVAKP